VALVSLVAQLALCQFFSFGQKVPETIDINPSNLWILAYHFPPTGSFQVLNWLGSAFLPQPLNPFSFAAAHFSPWLFFTFYAPVVATLALLAMAAFLRELECSRPAALFGGVIYAWQGDLLCFIFPAHFGYITTWPFFAMAAWGALRAQRTGYWAYAVVSGACCGLMVELQADRGGIASLLIAGLYVAPVVGRWFKGRFAVDAAARLRPLALCAGVAVLIALASLLALFQSNISGVKLGGETGYEETYKFVTQFSLGPAETLSYLVPGFFGWHDAHPSGPYWGWIGETFDWPNGANSMRNFNLAISTTGTAASALALVGAGLLLPWRLFGPSRLTERQVFYGRTLLGLGSVALVLAWGWHTPLYRLAFLFPLMDKWRDPLKWLEMTNFALIVLGAFGAEHLMASFDARWPEVKVVRQRLAWFTGGLLLLLGAGLLASYPFAISLAAVLQPEQYTPPAIANIMDTLHVSLLVALAVMALFCILLRALWRPGWLRRLNLVNPWLNSIWHRMFEPEKLALTLALGLAALGVAQLGWVATQFIHPEDLRRLTESNALLEQLSNEGNTVRVSAAAEDPALNALLLNQFNADRISCLDISAASRVPDDISAFFSTLENDRARMWFLAGVKDVVVPQRYLAQMCTVPAIAENIERADGYMLEETGSPDIPSHALVTLRDYLAKATLVPNAEVIPTTDAMLERLKDPAWNPRASILLSSPTTGPRSGAVADAKGGAGKPDDVELQNYGPMEIDLAVQSARGGYVLIDDQYDPDWQVEINGHDAALLRADFILRAVAVPPGASKIVMRYEARYHVAGVGLPVVWVNNFSDGVMLMAWVVAGVALWRRGPAEGSNPAVGR
jgi:hypothetical protein